jgi:hypothetical protein
MLSDAMELHFHDADRRATEPSKSLEFSADEDRVDATRT